MRLRKRGARPGRRSVEEEALRTHLGQVLGIARISAIQIENCGSRGKRSYVRQRTDGKQRSRHNTRVHDIPLGRAVLERVIDKLGGIDAASARLGVSAALIAKFLDGSILMPDAVLLRAVDLVLDEEPTIPTDSKPFQRTQP